MLISWFCLLTFKTVDSVFPPAYGHYYCEMFTCQTCVEQLGNYANLVTLGFTWFGWLTRMWTELMKVYGRAVSVSMCMHHLYIYYYLLLLCSCTAFIFVVYSFPRLKIQQGSHELEPIVTRHMIFSIGLWQYMWTVAWSHKLLVVYSD